jgi:hypothetical protein
MPQFLRMPPPDICDYAKKAARRVQSSRETGAASGGNCATDLRRATFTLSTCSWKSDIFGAISKPKL